jgi:hypothetical protein
MIAKIKQTQYAHSGAVPPVPAGPITIMNAMKKINRTTIDPIPKPSRSVNRTYAEAVPELAQPLRKSHNTSATSATAKNNAKDTGMIHSADIPDILNINLPVEIITELALKVRFDSISG